MKKAILVLSVIALIICACKEKAEKPTVASGVDSLKNDSVAREVSDAGKDSVFVSVQETDSSGIYIFDTTDVFFKKKFPELYAAPGIDSIKHDSTFIAEIDEEFTDFVFSNYKIYKYLPSQPYYIPILLYTIGKNNLNDIALSIMLITLDNRKRIIDKMTLFFDGYGSGGMYKTGSFNIDKNYKIEKIKYVKAEAICDKITTNYQISNKGKISLLSYKKEELCEIKDYYYCDDKTLGVCDD
jgi:hypothetical protein